MKKLKECLELFLMFFKIGLFTFGGGYAMISLISHEVVDKRKYIDSEEFSDLVAIAESTPGPIAINSATYIGYKKAGVLGSIAASIGVVLPSLIIIYLISLFLAKVLEYTIVQKAFSGIQCGVSVLIFTAGVKLIKNVRKNWVSYVLAALSFCLLLVINFTGLQISTIYFVIVGAIVGIVLYYRPTQKPDNRPIDGDFNKNSSKQGAENEQKSDVCQTITTDNASQKLSDNGDCKDVKAKGKKSKLAVVLTLSITGVVIIGLLFFGGLYRYFAKDAIENMSTSPIYLRFLKVSELFTAFFKIGAFSFGGGYGMLPLMLEETVGRNWLTEAEFANFLAVAESTPGPVSINMATYVGSTQSGFLGSCMATLGVVTPSIIIILLIVAVLKDFLQYKIVRSALSGMKPVICGMILATGADLALTNVFPMIESLSFAQFSVEALFITAVIAFITVLFKKLFKKAVSPILLIVISAAFGMLLM